MIFAFREGGGRGPGVRGYDAPFATATAGALPRAALCVTFALQPIFLQRARVHRAN
jgi:hypothetical protein